MTIEVDFPLRADEKRNPHSASHTRTSSLASAAALDAPHSASSPSSSSVVTVASISAVCRQRADQYETAVINDVLQLSYRAYTAIEPHVFASFHTLHSLYLDHNKLSDASLVALQSAPRLTALFLHSNHITSLAALPALHRLRNLNVSENALTDLQGVERLTALVTLDASHNAVAAVEPLRSLPHLRDLLLSHNCVSAAQSPLPTLAALPSLRVLHLHHNPLVTQQPAYRRTVLSQLPSLHWLDERGVKEDERAGVEGWKKSGAEGEREARARLLEERRQREERQWQQWKDSRAAHRALHEKRVSYSSSKHDVDYEDEADSTNSQTAQPALNQVLSLSAPDVSLSFTAQPAAAGILDASTADQAALTPSADQSLDDYHVMRSLSIDQYYQTVQQAVPTTLDLLSDDDDEDDDERVDSAADSPAAVPFLLGITPALALPALSSEAALPRPSSATASPPSSSPSTSLPLSLSSTPASHSREPSALMSAFVLSQSHAAISEEKEETPYSQPPDCRQQVSRVLAMLSEEAAVSQYAGGRAAVREINVSEEDSDAEESAQWVSYGVESSSDEDEVEAYSSRPNRRR